MSNVICTRTIKLVDQSNVPIQTIPLIPAEGNDCDNTIQLEENLEFIENIEYVENNFHGEIIVHPNVSPIQFINVANENAIPEDISPLEVWSQCSEPQVSIKKTLDPLENLLNKLDIAMISDTDKITIPGPVSELDQSAMQNSSNERGIYNKT